MSNSITHAIEQILGRRSATATTTASDGTQNVIEMLRTVYDRSLSTSNGMEFAGAVTTGGSTTAHVISTLLGLGDDRFTTSHYYMFVARTTDDAAPLGQWRAVTDYASATGTFTTVAFGAAMTTADYVVIVHESVYWGYLLKYMFGAADASLAYVVDDSIVGHILAIDGDVADYDDNKHSLEAIGTDTDEILSEGAKIPKSDSNVTWNATALGSVNAEVDTALNTIVPAAPTAGSLNDALSKASGGNTFDKATDSNEAIGEDTDALILLHAVPAKDAITDANLRDVAGKKDDTAVTTATTTKSIMAYVKGCLSQLATVITAVGTTIPALHNVPTKDADTDTYMRDVVGKKDDTAVTTVGTTKTIIAYAKGVINQVATIITNLGNSTGDMSAVTQSESGSVAAHIKNTRNQQRGVGQTRIALIIPSLTNIASDPDNVALFTELSKWSTANYIDQTEVDNGEQDWSLYDALCVGSDKYAAFTTTNIDDLITMKVPVLVCNSPVAAFMGMGTAAADGNSSVNEYCETLGNRVTAKELGTVGEHVLFSPAATSDRLDMSDAQLAEEVLLVNTTGDGNALVVLGWLPVVNHTGTPNELDDATEMPAGRVFGGCFNNGDNLTTLGLDLFAAILRNLTQSVVQASITSNANASKINDIDKDLGEPNDTTTDTVHGKIGTDTEMGDVSLYDMLKYFTLVADGGTHAYPDSVVQESIFAYIMSASADPVITSYDNAKHSLQAIGTDTDSLITAVGAIPTTAMRGTDDAALAATALTDATWTDAKAAFLDAKISDIPTTAMRGTDDATLQVTWTDAKAAFVDAKISDIPTTMVGTDDAFLASVGGAINDTTTDSLHGKIGTDTEMADSSFFDRIGKSPFDGVWFDSVSGGAGTALPVGAPQSPSNAIASVITMCTARNTKKIYVDGALTLTAQMEGYIFVGASIDTTITLGSQDVDGSEFVGCTVTGTQGGTGTIKLRGCIASAIVNFSGSAFNTIWKGVASTLRTATINYFFNCNTEANVVAVKIGFNTDASLISFGAAGTWEISNLTNAAKIAMFFCYGAAVKTNANCTAGTVAVYGSAIVTNGGGGATVMDGTLEGQLGTPAGASLAADIIALKAVADAIPVTAMRGTNDAALAATALSTAIWTAAKAAFLDGKITDVAKTIPLFKMQPCDSDDVLHVLEFTAVAADKDFPNVVFPAGFLPSGAAPYDIRLCLSFNEIYEDSAAANYLIGGTLRIKKAAGAWNTDDIVALTLPAVCYDLLASATGSGDVIEGTTNLISEVDDVDDVTYNIRSEETNRGDAIVAHGESLFLKNVHTFLKVYYKVG